MDKRSLLNAVIEVLEKDLRMIFEASNEARSAATDPQAKAEHKYDTRGLEQSYLADGLGKRMAEVMSNISLLKSMPLVAYNQSSPIEVSAVVEVENEEGERQSFFILPVRGGIKISDSTGTIVTLSPESSLGAGLLSKTQGDAVEITIKHKKVFYTIVSVR